MYGKIKNNLPEDLPNETKLHNIDKNQFGNCKVCDDKASGVHYGVASCEGCKGFYKRTIAKKKLHSCNYNNNCEINIKNRKKCKACRFKKCLTCGMCLESIKMGRIPTIQKLEMIRFKNINSDSNKTGDYTLELKKNIQNEKQEIVEKSLKNKIDEPAADLDHNLDEEIAIQNNMVSKILNNEANAIYDEIEDVRNSIEQIMSIYDDTQSNTVDLNNRDEYIRKNFDLDIFLKSQTKTTETTNLLTNQDLFFDMDNENMLYFLTLIRDKVNQVYIEFTKPVQKNIQLAYEIIDNVVHVPTAAKEDAWNIFLSYLKTLAPSFVNFVIELPGLSTFCQHDFTTIIDNNLPVLFAFLNTKLYINNELYLVIENTRIDRNAFEQFFGALLCFSIFEFHESLNNLNLKNEELALLIPFILTSTDVLLVDDAYLKELNLYYARALLYECSSNNRDRKFMNKLAQTIEMKQALKKGFSSANKLNIFI